MLSNAFACKDHYFPCTNMVITLLAHAVVVHGVAPDELRDVKLQPVGAVTPGQLAGLGVLSDFTHVNLGAGQWYQGGGHLCSLGAGKGRGWSGRQ